VNSTSEMQTDYSLPISVHSKRLSQDPKKSKFGLIEEKLREK